MSDTVEHSRIQPVPDDKCPRCGGAMLKGKALFAVGSNAMWEGKAPPVKLHDCLKCNSCGHSEKFEAEFEYGVRESETRSRTRPMNNERANQPRIPERDALHGYLRQATQQQLLALAELGVWMEKHHELLLAGRANGIRLGATKEVIQFMLDSLDPDLAGMVAGNLVQLPN